MLLEKALWGGSLDPFLDAKSRDNEPEGLGSLLVVVAAYRLNALINFRPLPYPKTLRTEMHSQLAMTVQNHQAAIDKLAAGACSISGLSGLLRVAGLKVQKSGTLQSSVDLN